MRVEKQWRWNGQHYQQTAIAWLDNLDYKRNQLLPILAKTYGDAEAKRWWMRWRLFFLAVAELFAYENGEQWYVSHYLLAQSHQQSQGNATGAVEGGRSECSAV